MKIHKNIDITSLNTLKIKCIAKCLIQVDTIDELKIILFIAEYFCVDFVVIGKGSKILFKDQVVEKLLLQFSLSFQKVIFAENIVYVDAGCTLSTLIKECYMKGLGGLHKLVMIPSTIGGAIINNTGIGDCEISTNLSKVICIDKSRKMQILNKDMCQFSYRDSLFKKENLIVIGAIFTLYSCDQKVLKKEMQYQVNRRLANQEVFKNTCGSLFKNPVGYKAYELIEKSFDVTKDYNGAHLSKKHHNFLINEKNATAKDVILLIEDIKKAVYARFKICLEPELIII